MTPKRPGETSPGERVPHHNKARERQAAIIEDAGGTADEDRDLVHGEGGTIGLPAERDDLSKDD